MSFIIRNTTKNIYDLIFTDHTSIYLFSPEEFEKYFHIPDISTELKNFNGFIRKSTTKLYVNNISFPTEQDAQNFINDFLSPYVLMKKLAEA